MIKTLGRSVHFSGLVIAFKAFQRTEIHLYLLSSMLRIAVLRKWQMIYLEYHVITCLLSPALMHSILRTNYANTTTSNMITRNWFERVLSVFLCPWGISQRGFYTAKWLCFRLLRIVVLCMVKPPTGYVVGLDFFILFSIFKSLLFWNLILFFKHVKYLYGPKVKSKNKTY